MAKAPAFQFYVKDWLSDPAVRLCSHATRGIWIDCLCLMWEAPERGKLTGTADQLRRVLGLMPDEFEIFIEEVKDTNVGSVTVRNKKITLTNRRMEREENARISNAERQKKYRNAQNNGDNNTKVTPPSSSSSSSSSSKYKNTPPIPPASASPKTAPQPPKQRQVESVIFPPEFSEWMRVYGESPSDASLTAWKVTISRQDCNLSLLEQKLMEWQESEQWANGYVPSAENFLRKGYWQRKPPPPKPQQPARPGDTPAPRQPTVQELAESGKLRVERPAVKPDFDPAHEFKRRQMEAQKGGQQ